MDKLSKAIQVLEDLINYAVRNMDEVSVELDFESADVILELLIDYKSRMRKIGEHIKNARMRCGEIDSILLQIKDGEQSCRD